jgi:hypothetical protein
LSQRATRQQHLVKIAVRINIRLLPPEFFGWVSVWLFALCFLLFDMGSPLKNGTPRLWRERLTHLDRLDYFGKSCRQEWTDEDMAFNKFILNSLS